MFEIKLPSSEQLEDLLFNQKQIVNTLASDKLVLSVYWDKSSNPTLVRSDAAVGMTAAVGIDGQLVKNDFDNAPIYREIGEVIDALGNVFVRIPKFYIRKRSGKNFHLLQISKTKYPGFYLPHIFWDFTNNKELDYYDHGKHKASLSGDNKLESKPNTYALIKKNIVEFRNYAKANNVNGLSGYQQLDVHAQDVLQTLFTIEFATLHSQSIMQGFSTGQYSSSHKAVVAETAVNRIIVPNATADLYRVGQAISVGKTLGGNEVFYGRTITAISSYDASNKAITFDGDPVNIAVDDLLYNTAWKSGFSKDIAASSGSIVANDGKYPCVYRGIEDPFAGMWQFVDGVNINENQAWVCKNAEQYASNVFTSPYEKLGFINTNVNGYPVEMGFDSVYPFAQFPKAVGGSSTTYYSDYYYQNTGQRIALVGGRWSNGADAGLWYWALSDSSSSANSSFGGRLLKKAL